MSELERHLHAALTLREPMFEKWHSENTNCYRIFHGTTEGFSGLSIDRYGSNLLFQTWRPDLLDIDVVHHLTNVIRTSVGHDLRGVWNQRQKRGQVFAGNEIDEQESCQALELGLRYDARLRHAGIDPLLFLDFRAARRWIQNNSAGKSVLNLFSYTCGVGVAALSGGAAKVLNVDFAERSLDVGRTNARLNGLSESRFGCLHEDVIPVIRQFSGLGVKGRAARRPFKKLQPTAFDLVVLDPPRMAKSRFGKVDLVNDYASLFKPVALIVAKGGRALVTNNVASVDESEWHDRLSRCATKAGRPFERITPLRPESDFPSPDSRWPLKMAVIDW